MLHVDYPALPSYFHGKDAIVRTYGHWTTLKNFFRHQCYTYPVVYTDGLLSYVVSDGNNRTPWGIAIGDYVIAIHAPKEEMLLSDALRHSRSVEFANHTGCFMDIEVLRYVRMNLRTFNKMLKALGGAPLELGIYPSSTYSGNKMMAIDFTVGHSALLFMDDDLDEKSKVICRPAVNLIDLY